MATERSKPIRILGIAPSTSGFGFSVLERENVLVDWGAKTVKGDKNSLTIARIEDLILQYRPDALTIPEIDEDAQRSERIRELVPQIRAMARSHSLTVEELSHTELKRVLLGNDEGTKHSIAEYLANRFPDELGKRLPPKRRPWMSEDHRMPMFEAVALTVVVGFKRGCGGLTPKPMGDTFNDRSIEEDDLPIFLHL